MIPKKITFIVISSLCLVSCKNDDDVVSEGTLLSQVNLSYSYGSEKYRYDYDYDDSGKLVGVERFEWRSSEWIMYEEITLLWSGQGISKIAYSDNSEIALFYFDETEVVIEFSREDGFSDIERWVYENDGNLYKVTEGDDQLSESFKEYNLTWSDGKVVQVAEFRFPENEQMRKWSYGYGNIRSPYFGVLPSKERLLFLQLVVYADNCWEEFLTWSNEFIPSAASEIDFEYDQTYNLLKSYKFESNRIGLLTKITLTDDDIDDTTIEYIYQ